MNLQDVSVDLEGKVIAIGEIRYPIDDKGHFLFKPHDCIRIYAQEHGIHAMKRGLRLGTAHAVRDPKSGFLIAQETGVFVTLPLSFSEIIKKALRHEPSRPLHASFSDTEGDLAWDSDENIKDRRAFHARALPQTDPLSSKSQWLSDWKLEITMEGELLKIQLSAALFAPEPTQVWQKSSIGHWSVSNDTPPRIEIEFLVNLPTRVAAFHAADLHSQRQSTYELVKAGKTSLLNFNLKNAPIDTMGNIFGVTLNGEWVKFEAEEESFSIIPHAPLSRLVNGFFACESGKYPVIRMYGIGMNIVLKLLGSSKKLHIELNNNEGLLLGRFDFHYSDDGVNGVRPTVQIHRAALDFQLGMHGLEFSYELDLIDNRTPSQRSRTKDSITLCWEILALRYPKLLRNRTAVLKEYAESSTS